MASTTTKPNLTESVLKPHTRILELDALRALAAINLVLFHYTHVYAVKFGYSSPLGFEWPYGAYGVEMFFILSGFVNSMSLLRRGQPADFVAARLIRIVPFFMMAIVANVFILRLAPMYETVSTGQFLANLTLIPRILGHECVDPVMWTLQIEMMFYANARDLVQNRGTAPLLPQLGNAPYAVTDCLPDTRFVAGGPRIGAMVWFGNRVPPIAAAGLCPAVRNRIPAIHDQDGDRKAMAKHYRDHHCGMRLPQYRSRETQSGSDRIDHRPGNVVCLRQGAAAAHSTFGLRQHDLVCTLPVPQQSRFSFDQLS